VSTNGRNYASGISRALAIHRNISAAVSRLADSHANVRRRNPTCGSPGRPRETRLSCLSWERRFLTSSRNRRPAASSRVSFLSSRRVACREQRARLVIAEGYYSRYDKLRAAFRLMAFHTLTLLSYRRS